MYLLVTSPRSGGALLRSVRKRSISRPTILVFRMGDFYAPFCLPGYSLLPMPLTNPPTDWFPARLPLRYYPITLRQIAHHVTSVATPNFCAEFFEYVVIIFSRTQIDPFPQEPPFGFSPTQNQWLPDLGDSLVVHIRSEGAHVAEMKDAELQS